MHPSCVCVRRDWLIDWLSHGCSAPCRVCLRWMAMHPPWASAVFQMRAHCRKTSAAEVARWSRSWARSLDGMTRSVLCAEIRLSVATLMLSHVNRARRSFVEMPWKKQYVVFPYLFIPCIHTMHHTCILCACIHVRALYVRLYVRDILECAAYLCFDVYE